MTHTNHREGTIEGLRGDWVVLMMAAKGINDHEVGTKLQKFFQLSLNHDPINGGCFQVGSALCLGWDALIEGVGKAKPPMAQVVFGSKEKVVGFIHDLKQADLGLSVVVSGLHAEIADICKQNGLRRHTVQYSLGVWGKTRLLPDPRISEMTTMCGHGMISFNVVRRMAKAVRNGKLSLEEASAELAKPCMCGIFNTRRARILLREDVPSSRSGKE
jgi:hypothetical protein